jgi:hypothetical protein
MEMHVPVYQVENCVGVKSRPMRARHPGAKGRRKGTPKWKCVAHAKNGKFQCAPITAATMVLGRVGEGALTKRC